MLGSALFTLSIVVANTFWSTMEQQHVPNEALGRVDSISWMISLVIMPIGYVVTGPVAEAIGTRETLVLAAAIGAASSLAALASRSVRELRRLEDSEVAQAGVSDEKAAPLGPAGRFVIRVPDSFGVLRERPFRLLWLAQATSAVGDAMTPVALVFAVLDSGGSAGDLGFVFAASRSRTPSSSSPGAGPAAGAAARPVTCDVVRGAAQAVLAGARDHRRATSLAVHRARGGRRVGGVVLRPRLDRADPANRVCGSAPAGGG